ncbi:type VI secretion system Vgr family protein [Paraburkholderia sp. 22098]|uniref:type VI secretion system Vgr family protein n=1 Tax=Paraburkholderia sp. 22098 TaxID=3453874 RepID=UPI003F877A97
MSFNNASDGISASGGSIAGLLSGAESFAGVASSLGGPVGSSYATGVVNQAARAVQLAQTASNLIGKTPSAVADAINSLATKPQLTQQNRFMSIRTPLGPDVLLVTALVADEYLNRLPEIHLDLISQRRDIQIDSLVGQVVSVSLKPEQGGLLSAVPKNPNQSERFFHGFVISFSRVGNSGTVTRYQMTVVPWLWFLSRSTDCRIFQNKTPSDILAEIFSEFGFSDYELNLQGQYKPFEYIVMYRESYFNFVARLMEQEGLIWWIRHEKDKHVLVISDSNAGFRAIDGLAEIPFYADSAASEKNGISQWNEAFSFRVGKITYRDFNHRTPSTPLLHVEVPSTLSNPNIQNTERYEYHSLYDHGDDGERYARIAMEAEEAQAHHFNGASYVQKLDPGLKFKLVNHPVSAFNNKDFALLHVRHEAANDYTHESHELPYRNSFSCLPVDIPYRAERRTPKPYMYGTQSAVVVGPEGEEVHTDGSSVKVHFFWDRRGKQDGSDSMWVRVAQSWAGGGWGGSAMPRTGQEVLVAFNEGDPDNPIIVGRVFNGEKTNPYHHTAGRTMGLRSKTINGDGFNELKFSDVAGSEEVFIHAQKNLNTVVKDSETRSIEAGNRLVRLHAGDETKDIAKGSLTETIAKARATTANTIDTKAVGGEAGPGNQMHQATDKIEHRVGASIITMKPDSIKLSHGASSILINQSGIFLDGPVIHLNQGLFVTPEQALAIQWAQQQAIIAAGLASPDPKVRDAAKRLQASVKAQQMAKLADAVYSPGTAPPGWSNISNDPEALKKLGLRPEDLKIPGSNFGSQAYAPDPAVFGDSMKPTVAFKGTEQLTGEDMANNLAQGQGKLSPYYAQAVKIGSLVDEKDMASGVEMTGHSLGGGLAAAASEASGSTATTFNAAGLNSATLPLYGASQVNSSITNYRVDGDILTGMQEGKLGPISDATAAVMPKAVGEQIDIPGSAMTTLSRHKMAEVNAGMESTVADQQSSLLQLLGTH